MFSRIMRDPGAIAGLMIMLIVIVTALLAPALAPHNPEPVNLGQKLLPPESGFPLGTDALGRCLYSRILFGARVTLQYSFSILIVIMAIGVPFGLLAGYRGGFTDTIIMRIVDTILAFPNLILALVLVGLLGPGLFNVMLALALVSWVGYARIVRGMVLSIKEKEYIAAAKICGTKSASLIIRHILPNVLPPLVVLATLDLGKLVLSIATLSFLGLGAQPPTPEWGAMINDARPYLQTVPRLMIAPGAAIALTVLGFNLLGDGLRDILDPRMAAGNGHNKKYLAWLLPGGGKAGDSR